MPQVPSGGTALFSNQHSAGVAGNDYSEGRTKNWWTGEDSNLRSPQGAAGLQPAAISRSATRPRTAHYGEPLCSRTPCLYGELLPVFPDPNFPRRQNKTASAHPPRRVSSRPRKGSRSFRPEPLERETGIEPATNSLEGCDSTTELLPPPKFLEPMTGIEPVTSSLPRTRSTN